MEKKIFKVEASYFIEAEDSTEAEQIVANDTDFIENHILIREASDDEYEDIDSGLEDVYNKKEK